MILPRTLHRFSRLALPLLLSGSQLSAQPVAETEPNNALAEADYVGAAHDEVLILGTIGADGSKTRDVDLFHLEIPSDMVGPFRLRADVRAIDPSVDLYLRLFDAQGKQVQRSDDRGLGDPDPLIARTILAPGHFYIGVSTNVNTLYDATQANGGLLGNGGAYRLLISLDFEQNPSSALEPNDDLESPTPMVSVSTVVTGEFIGDGPTGASDQDAYILSLPGPAIVRATVYTKDNSLLDPFISVMGFTPGCWWCRIGEDENDDLVWHTVDAQAVLPIFSAADVAIWVRGGPWETEGRSYGYYDLEVEITPIDVSGENEPDDSISMATDIGGGGRREMPEEFELVAHLGDGPYAITRGDRDFYAYWPPSQPSPLPNDPQPRFVEFAAESTDQSFVPIISAYDADARIFARTSGGLGVARLVLPAVCTRGIDQWRGPAFYLAVTSAGQRPILDARVPFDEGPGDFISIARHDTTVEEHLGGSGPYRLTGMPRTPSPDCAAEPNNTIEMATDTGVRNAGVFVCDAWIDDRPETYGEEDIWAIHLDHPRGFLQVSVSVCDTDNSLADYTVRVLDANGIVLQEFSDPSWDNVSDFEVHSLHATLDRPGDYFIEVSGDEFGSYGAYDIAIVLGQGPPDAPLPMTTSSAFGEPVPVPNVYASRLDGAAATIDVLDALSGKVLTSFVAPEQSMTGAEALVPSTEGLLFGGVGRYPAFYHLSPFTGEILGSFLGFFGSGQYSDAAMLGNTLYVLDLRQQSIHAVDPQGRFVKRTLPIGNRNGITIGGGLAALAAPNRLFAADAFDTRRIYEIDPNTGALLRTLPETELRAVALGGVGESELFVGDWTESRVDILDRDGVQIDSIDVEGPAGSIGGTAYAETPGDVNGDEQIDLHDVEHLYTCFGSSSGDSNCAAADLDRDGWILAADAAVLASNLVGP